MPGRHHRSRNSRSAVRPTESPPRVGLHLPTTPEHRAAGLPPEYISLVLDRLVGIISRIIG